MSSYLLIIFLSVVIILSYLFNIISNKTNVPSVVLLIGLGLLFQYLFKWFDIGINVSDGSLNKPLEILGVVGLIMIVLEAALDLDLSRDKLPVLIKSFFAAFISLLLTSFAIAMVINFFFQDAGMLKSLIYAIPLSILSSAIIIPSVQNLGEEKKEFMIYEGTFSDILGIMFFYLLLGNLGAENTGDVVFSVGTNIIATIILSVVSAYLLIWVFQKLKSQTKLFLLISVLLLLYALGKEFFHLSSLVIILVFGLFMNNTRLFFGGRLKKLIDEKAHQEVLHSFHNITMETAFVIRTLFFVVFGMAIALSDLLNIRVPVISAFIIVFTYAIRYLSLKLMVGKNILPEVFIAPRGLITILLFFAIPTGENGGPDYTIKNFESGVLLFVIITTAVIMTVSLIRDKKRNERRLLKESYEDTEGENDSSQNTDDYVI